MIQHFEIFGKIIWLWSHSPLHRRWPVESAIHYIIPALEHKQCLLMTASDGTPRGYVSWAWLSLETEQKYILNPNSLDYNDWNSGNRLWFIDFISPFSFKDTTRLRRMMGKIHGEHYLARSIRLNKDGHARVVEHTGGSINHQQSNQLRHQYYQEIATQLTRNKKA